MDGFSNGFREIGEVATQHNAEDTIPIALSYCKTSKLSHILALSDEDGYVSLFNTRHKFPEVGCFEKNAEDARIFEWIAHNNAVFDICWIKEDTQILTASGDQTIKVWDVQERKCLGVLTGYTGSVKSICSHPTNADIIVSGSRDGSFCLWDLRCHSNDLRGLELMFGMQSDLHLRGLEVNGKDSVKVLVATKAKPNKDVTSPLDREFFKSFLNILKQPQNAGRFNFTTQFPCYEEVTYRPDFQNKTLGKPVVFDMDMSAGDFLALFYLLKVPVEVINLKVHSRKLC